MPGWIGTTALLLVAGVFAGMIGAALFLLRGSPRWSSDRGPRLTGTFGWATFGWGLFFAGTGAATLIASKTSEAMSARRRRAPQRPAAPAGSAASRPARRRTRYAGLRG